MEAGRRSRTAEGAAALRALHQVLDEPRILDDPIAGRLVGQHEVDRQKKIARLLPFLKRLRAHFAMRSRYAEDCLAESIDRGVRQYVLLGAGLDTFAYRQPPWANQLRVFEVDHPATQEWKREKLAAAQASIPANLTFAGVDFEKVSLREGLVSAGLDFSVPTFFSCLGVTQYLTAASFEGSLKLVASMPAGSEIVFSFVVAASDLSNGERFFVGLFAAIAAASREPWLSRFDPRELADKLTALGFSKVIHFSSEAATDRYFRERRDGLALTKVEQMMRAIV